MPSLTAVSLEKRLIIRPRGFESKKRIEARVTLLSILLWSSLLRYKYSPAMLRLERLAEVMRVIVRIV